jgi:hypothetical protein
MWVIVPFTLSGVPKTGLTPSIKIYEVDSESAIINDEPMGEISNSGFYKYNFTSYEMGKNYAIIADGGTSLGIGERFFFGGNDNLYEDVASIIATGGPRISFDN